MEERIGHVTHFYTRIRVAVLQLDAAVETGDFVHFLGHTTDFTQRVDSMEIEHQKIASAEPGQEVALKVISRVRAGDTVFKIIEE
jgi:hypothetical protein